MKIGLEIFSDTSAEAALLPRPPQEASPKKLVCIPKPPERLACSRNDVPSQWNFLSREENNMGLFVSEKDLIQGSAAVELRSGSMKTLFVYGNEANIMVATRSPGYHSKPHKHLPEQLNYAVSGELWIFIEDDGYLLKKGDFLRVPSNALHWAWNRGDVPSVLVQVHAPVHAPEHRAGTLGLFGAGEKPNVKKSPPPITVDIDTSDVERRVFERVGIAT